MSRGSLRRACALPFLNGVYVAVDALPDATVVVDGPYCAQTKAEMQQGHNLASSLLSPLGVARVRHTGSRHNVEEVASLTTDREEHLRKTLEEAAQAPGVGVLFFTLFDFHQLVHVPIARILSQIESDASVLRCPIPSRSLGGSWLEGYDATTAALAAQLPLDQTCRRAGCVGLVGHLHDRDEPDGRANLEEMARLLGSVGLDLAPIWLGGGDVCALERIAEAERIFALPYGGETARILGERLGIPVHPVGLPLGLTGTSAFLYAVADAMGCRDRATDFVDREERSVIADVAPHVTRFIAGAEVSVLVSDPHLQSALETFCEDVGVTLREVDDDDTLDPPRLCLASTNVSLPTGWIPVSVGYPNFAYHPVTPRATLGYAGIRTLVDRIAEALVREEVRVARERTWKFTRHLF